MDAIGRRTIRRVKWRLLPFICVLYFINMIDRSTVSYAALTMNKELGISMVAFGMLTSIFALPYFLCEVPSNMLLNRYGARRWIARIMITWGIVTSLAMWAQNYWHIAAVRFLLGMMEAGFLPGIMFYLTVWLPQRERAWAIAMFSLALPLNTLVGSPVSGLVLDHVHWFGYSGWRWLFVFDGVPAVILGIFALFYLTDRPSEAGWLSEEEKNWLTEEIKKEDAKKREARRVKITEIFSSLRTWKIGIVYLFMSLAGAGMGYFLPMVIKEFSKVSNTSVGLLMMIPAIVGGVFMVTWSWHSDRTMERKYHAVIAMGLGIIGLLMASMVPSPVIKMMGITLGMMALFGVVGPFWAIPSLYLAGTSAAVGMAIISSCNALGQFLGGFCNGYLMKVGGNAVLAFSGACYVISMIVLLTLHIRRGATAAEE
ncbi:MAG TPA: MFS transporter [Syntrophorhabdaceae bacterium]|nr:MFS transporter [Syntrophorhabdaceae bacterium]